MHHSVPFTTLTDAKNLETLLGREPSSHAPICRAETPKTLVSSSTLECTSFQNESLKIMPKTEQRRPTEAEGVTQTDRRIHRKGEEEKPRRRYVCVSGGVVGGCVGGPTSSRILTVKKVTQRTATHGASNEWRHEFANCLSATMRVGARCWCSIFVVLTRKRSSVRRRAERKEMT